MRTLRRSVAGAVSLGLIASMSVAAAAQSTEADVMTGEAATWVTFIDQSCSVDPVDPTESGAIQRMRGTQTICDVSFDDPRVSGTVTTIGNYDCHATAGCVTWGQQTIVGPDGEWGGSFSGVIDSEFTERAVALLAGTEGYAGMTFFVHAVAPLGEPPTVVGLIYEGLPPVIAAPME